jgi:hypothetical protein
MRLVISAILLGAATVAAVACAPRAGAPSPISSDTPAPTVAAATTTPATTSVPTTAGTAQPASTGTISGIFAYPAEGNPAVTIYAVSTTDRSVFFSVAIPRSTPGSTTKPPYSITGVRPGTYYLIAYTDGSDAAGGAYTEFVKCGLNASCSDHTLIGVTVGAGQTVRDIDVSDWYAPAGTFPPRPR